MNEIYFWKIKKSKANHHRVLISHFFFTQLFMTVVIWNNFLKVLL